MEMKRIIFSLLTFVIVSYAVADIADPQDPGTWKVTANEYQYSMTITTALVFDMEESRDVTDKIAAFVGNDCRGMAQPITYIPQHDRFLAHVLVYSNMVEGETVKLYMYDASENHLVEVAETLVFAANATYGSTSDPYLSITTYDVSVSVYAGDDPVKDAEVELDGYGDLKTDETGLVTFKHVTPANEILYSVKSDGYDEYRNNVSLIDQDVTDSASLTLTRSFYVCDGTDPLANAKIVLDKYGVRFTNQSGVASYSDISPSDSLYYRVSLEKYDVFTDSIKAVPFGSESEEIVLNLTRYNVDFYVLDSGMTVNNATVSLNGYESSVTDIEGHVHFEKVLPSDSIYFSITTEAYDFYSGAIAVPDQDVSFEVDIDLTAFEVAFQVTDGKKPLGNVEVYMKNYGKKYTDVYGNVKFSYVVLTDNQEYTVSADGYYSVSNSFPVVDKDIVIKTTLSKKTYNLSFYVSEDMEALPGEEVTIEVNNEDRIIDFTSTVFSDEFETKGNDPWDIIDDLAYQGQLAAKSGKIYDNQSSKLILHSYTRHGLISFFVKISSEDDDYLSFLVDGVEKGKWSGLADWKQYSFEIESGEHTFEWVYKKDGLNSVGEDCAWIDYITIPSSESAFYKAETNEDGLAEFYGVKPFDKIYYSILSEDHEYVYDSIAHLNDNEEFDIQLVPVYNLSFEVFSDYSTGRVPLKDVLITLDSRGVSGITDQDGMVTFERTSASQSIEFSASLDGYEELSGSTSLVDMDYTQEVTLTMKPALEATNLITPNGDGINDNWEIYDEDRYRSFDVYIYSSSGELIYHTNNYTENPWCGKNAGKDLPDGVYYYILKSPDRSLIFKGIINLLN